MSEKAPKRCKAFWDLFVPMSPEQTAQHISELGQRRWQCEDGQQAAVDSDRTLAGHVNADTPVCLDPTRNTGLITSPYGDSRVSNEVHLDYLDVMLPDRHAEVLQLLASHLGPTWSRPAWRSSGETSFGPEGTEARCRFQGRKTLLTFKGCACTSIGTTKLVDLLKKMQQQYGAALQVRRVDLALDDSQQLYSPADVRDRIWTHSIEDGAHLGRWAPGVVTSAHSCTWYSQSAAGVPESNSLYVGSSHADRRLLIYSTASRHPDMPPAIRWELRYSRNWTQHLLADIIRSSSDLGSVFCSHLVRFLDVRDPNSYGDKHPERRERCAWYSAIVGAASKAAPRQARKKNAVKMIEGDKIQIQRRFARYLGAHRESPHALEELLAAGKQKLLPMDYQIMEEFQAAMARVNSTERDQGSADSGGEESVSVGRDGPPSAR